MAIITISRQFGSKGDEICAALAKKLGYKLIDHEYIRQKILDLGFPLKKLDKFDGKNLSFFSNLSKYRDEYLYYLKTAVLSAADKDNCVIVGRGSFIILQDIANCVSFRILEPKKLRIDRVMKKFALSEKAATKKVCKEDRHQIGFHMNFFGFKLHTPFFFQGIYNSGDSDVGPIVDSIIGYTQAYSTEERQKKAKEQLNDLLLGQSIVNMLVFTYSININSFRAEVENKKIILYGISSSNGEVKRAIELLNCEVPGYEVESRIHIVQDSMANR
ncbi:AAA family ATPase [Treponema zioleckii]|uniref:cytidylate kinase-like family protein n=1 Tax=Treponema zioleckii TaxID=331680 RepID=UPI00168AD883|nr:cytidylate kinase-like family protein [Treponema zioleckii]